MLSYRCILTITLAVLCNPVYAQSLRDSTRFRNAIGISLFNIAESAFAWGTFSGTIQYTYYMPAAFSNTLGVSGFSKNRNGFFTGAIKGNNLRWNSWQVKDVVRYRELLPKGAHPYQRWYFVGLGGGYSTHTVHNAITLTDPLMNTAVYKREDKLSIASVFGQFGVHKMVSPKFSLEWYLETGRMFNSYSPLPAATLPGYGFTNGSFFVNLHLELQLNMK